MGLDQNLLTRDGQNLIYWRKVNCLHRYFTDVALNKEEVEDDNCTEFIIAREDLIELRDICVTIVTAYINQSMDGENTEEDPWEDLVDTLLPPQGGFFFGSTEVDNWYLTDLVDIIKDVSEVLGAYDDSEFIYYAWY